jgi:hypothetical protein
MENEMNVMPNQPDTPRNRGVDDAPHLSPVTAAEDVRTVMLNRISWGAVLAGVALSLVLQLILNLLGVGVGAATLDPAGGNNPSATGFSIGAAIWWTLSGIIAAFAGGYAAGRLSGQPKQSSAAWHGLTTWALTTLLIFYLLTSTLGSLVGGITSAIGSVASAAGGAVQTTVQAAAPAVAQSTDPFSSVEQSLRSATGGNDPGALRDAAIAAVRGLVTGDPAKAEEGRERAAQAIAKAQNIPVEQARTQVQQYEQQYRQTMDQTKQKATQAADTAAKATSRGALLGSLALLLGALAGWFGGRAGAVDPTVTSGVLRRREARRNRREAEAAARS